MSDPKQSNAIRLSTPLSPPPAKHCTVLRAHEGRHCRHRRRPARLEAVQGGYPTSQWTQLLLATQQQLASSSGEDLLLVALKMLEVRHMFQPQLLPLKPCDATRRVSPNCQPLRPRIRSAVSACTVKSCEAPMRHCLTHAGEKVLRCRMVYDRVCA